MWIQTFFFYLVGVLKYSGIFRNHNCDFSELTILGFCTKTVFVHQSYGAQKQSTSLNEKQSWTQLQLVFTTARDWGKATD
jgi:hypothetical protein